MSQLSYLSFRPALEGLFLSRFLDRAEALVSAIQAGTEPDLIFTSEVAWATDGVMNARQRRLYRAAWSLLQDLVRAGWSPRMRGGRLEVAPPTVPEVQSLEEVHAEKERIRRIMMDARTARLAEARDFIRSAEDPAPDPRAIARIPINRLVADPLRLAEDLATIAALPRAERPDALRACIRPYLQLVTDDGRCAETGHRLKDIWRYFRFGWSNPPENTPGRTMLYLVRDEARPLHPVMALISLENAPIRVQQRDDHLGWTIESFVYRQLGLSIKQVEARDQTKEVDPAVARAAFKHLLDCLWRAVGELDLSGLCTREECERPSPKLLEKLASEAEDSATDRDKALARWRAGDESAEAERSELGNISREAEDALFRRKRADALGRFLSARVRLLELLEAPNFEIIWPDFLLSAGGAGAVRSALIAAKSRHVGTSILELNVCGAVPPYNEILGGKLAALLALSPRVVADYRRRYGGRSSDIASKLKGEPVVRPAELVYVGTTSLYAVGSSQYNRLSLPAGLFNSSSPPVSWTKIGVTKGYGTIHITRQTLLALEEVDTDAKRGVQRVNHVFGEGPSPKLRLLKSALNALMVVTPGSPLDEFARHSMSRLVYGAWLATNGSDYLNDREDSPKYVWPEDLDPDQGTEQIAEFWRSRWLASRLDHSPAIERIRAFEPASVRLGSELNGDPVAQFTPILEPMLPSMPSTQPSTEPFDTSNLAFVRDLYRGKTAYADGTSLDVLAQFHVPTDLDHSIMQALQAGRDVVLTGNPGDGKTHLLRVLATQINSIEPRPEVVLDASSIRNSELHRRWADAQSAGRPFCAAINEAVLFRIAQDYPDFLPVQEARGQVTEAIVYGTDSITNFGSVVVFDLSRRNVLAGPIVTAVLDRLTDESIWKRCARCPGCDYTQNRALLREPRVRERLQVLLDRVSRRGYHATLRELQALVAFLLLGGQTCDEMLRRASDRSQSPFHRLFRQGEGALFEQLRHTFDPARVSHPIWDELLLMGNTSRPDWVTDAPTAPDALEPTDLDRFEGRKRAFYFCHKDGDVLLQLAGDDESRFADFLAECERSPVSARRKLSRLLNRFFGGTDGGTELRIWESHRYNHGPRRTVYSSAKRSLSQFEIVLPKLRAPMAEAFAAAEDHALLRLIGKGHIRLRVDFSLYELLLQAERGVPALSLDGEPVRRLWAFMEQLSLASATDGNAEVSITVLNRATRQRAVVTVDTNERRYVSIQEGEG